MLASLGSAETYLNEGMTSDLNVYKFLGRPHERGAILQSK